MRTVTIAALGSSTKAATPKFKRNGRALDPVEWNLYGRIEINCASPGVDLQYRYKLINATTNAIIWTGPYHLFFDEPGDYNNYPIGWQPTNDQYMIVEAQAVNGGYTASDVATLTIKFKMVSTADAAF